MKKSSVYTCELPPALRASLARVRETVAEERRFAQRLEAQSRSLLEQLNLMLYGAGLVR